MGLLKTDYVKRIKKVKGKEVEEIVGVKSVGDAVVKVNDQPIFSSPVDDVEEVTELCKSIVRDAKRKALASGSAIPNCEIGQNVDGEFVHIDDLQSSVSEVVA